MLPPGASTGSVDLLPNPASSKPYGVTKLSKDDGKESDQVYSFDGKTNVVEVAPTTFNHSLGAHFTLSLWMKHEPSGQEAQKKHGRKEQILCNADGESMWLVTYIFTWLLARSLTHSLTQSLTHSLAHARNHSLTQSLTHSLARSLTHARNHSLTQSLTQSLTHSRNHSLTHVITHSLTYLLKPLYYCSDDESKLVFFI